jgi:competence protein ComEA
VADWPELARLPGIGEVIAKRIVAYRQEHSTTGGAPVFQSPQDLDAVSGIGPKLVDRISPYLKFSPAPSGP